MDYETRVKQTDANLASVYQPEIDFYNRQITELPGVYGAQRSQLDQARVNAFRKIEQAANARGMFFSGQPINQQLEYNFGTYDPSLSRINLAEKGKKDALEQALLGINQRRNQQARSIVAQQIAEENRAAEAAQRRADQERRHQERLRASYARSAAAGQISPNQAQKDFLSFIGGQFQRSGGAGNTRITRQMQDSWANQWMDAMGVKGAANRQFYWDTFNTAYNRNANPYADPRYAKSPAYGTIKGATY